MNKFLFSIEDTAENSINLYSVEAEDERNATTIFVKKFYPYLNNIDFDAFCNSLSSIDITVISLGQFDKIIEL